MKYTAGLGALIVVGALAVMASIPYRANTKGEEVRARIKYELAMSEDADKADDEFAKALPFQVSKDFINLHTRINARNAMRANPQLIEDEVSEAESKFYKDNSNTFYGAGLAFVVGCVLMALGLDINKLERRIG
jgi:hypothetical protein